MIKGDSWASTEPDILVSHNAVGHAGCCRYPSVNRGNQRLAPGGLCRVYYRSSSGASLEWDMLIIHSHSSLLTLTDIVSMPGGVTRVVK